ncbi:GNAT family N-acetyltransferase [Scatolibacter rhodanostii]|uniref:GNAT family N-acetyltransferase n=1 Tax=Scatolibacter rhodanostii TaxID=2014781 RepID=UPI000C08B530|nr:GNAT family protein [Scatolibacter rhodanostii]
MKIETTDLIIRNFELEDEKDLCEYMLQRVHAQFERYPDFTCQKSHEEIVSRAQSDEFFAIELKKEHKVIGNIYLGKRNFNSRELGYVLNENYHKKGYGSEASKAMVAFAFAQGVHRIYAECAPQNIASWKLMEKIGLEREAFFKKNVSFRSDEENNPIYWDTYVYAALNPNENTEIIDPRLSDG